MKKLKLLTLVFILLSCSGKKGEEASEENPRMTSDEIDVGRAAKLISNFLNQPDFDSLKSIAIGGTFDTTNLVLHPKRDNGLLFWYCLDIKKSVFKLAAVVKDRKFSYDSTDTVGIKWLGKKLYIPTYTFTYPASNGTDSAAVRKYILAYKSTDKLTTPAVDTMQIYNYKENFKKRFKKSHCRYPYAYFDRTDTVKHAMDNLYGRKPYAIRYYFGYDPNMKSNKIRVILIAVDQNGNVKAKENRDGGGGAVDLSWPPPPPTQ